MCCISSGRTENLTGASLQGSESSHNSTSHHEHGKLHLVERLSFREGFAFPFIFWIHDENNQRGERRATEALWIVCEGWYLRCKSFDDITGFQRRPMFAFACMDNLE